MRFRPQFRLGQFLFLTTAVCIVCAFPLTIGLPLVMCVVLMISDAAALLLNIATCCIVFGVLMALRNVTKSVVQMIYH